MEDNELAAIGIIHSPDLIDIGTAGMNFEVSALDVEGRLISTKNLAAAIELVGADGATVEWT